MDKMERRKIFSRAEQSRMTNMIMTYIKHPAVGIVRFRTISTVGCFCFVD